MKFQFVIIILSSLACLSSAQSYRCLIERSNCVDTNLRSIVERASNNLTQNVGTHLGNFISNIEETQSRIRNAINDENFKMNFRNELSGELQSFQAGADEFVADLRMRLTTSRTSIGDSIRRYTNNISFSHFEMVISELEEASTFSEIINAVREAKECFLDNLFERGFMNTTNAVRNVIERTLATIDRVAGLTKTVLVNLAPVIARIESIRTRFRPHQSCLEILATNLGCRLCEAPDRPFPCFDFCDQTLSYCLSVVRGALPDVRDVIRVVGLISDALEGREVRERFDQTLLSFATLARAVEELGENVIGFIQDFDIVEFIRDVASECFPGVVSVISRLYESFRNAVRNALAAIRSIIQGAIDRIRSRVENTINFFNGLFNRRRRHISSSITLLLLDQVLRIVADEFCENLPSTRGDECWNGTDVGAYIPRIMVSFSVDSQVENPAVISSEFNTQQALSSVHEAVNALGTDNADVCATLTASIGNASLYNELSNSTESCYSELNRSAGSLLASSLFFLLSMLIVYSLHLF